MAIMLPEKPREYSAASQEGAMFDALSLLSDDYYVFHSMSLTTVKSKTVHESETDFVVLNRHKGLVCIEAKAGHVSYRDGNWYYQSGLKMPHDGPFQQAAQNKWKLRRYVEDSKFPDFLDKCKMLHAVWFPSVTQSELSGIVFPPEADRQLVLTQEALTDPEPFFKKLFSLEVPGGIKTSLSDNDVKRIMREVLCPQFEIVPSKSLDSDIRKIVFHRLLREQANVLNFLEEQKTVAINGAAGTGKTLIALEKARRLAEKGQRVLFLCYNNNLKTHISKRCPVQGVDYYTISGYVCKICNTSEPDYKEAKEKLEDLFYSGSFPYDSVIIDEGQDFGMDSIDESDIVGLLRDIVAVDDESDGAFYIFYDRMQCVQSDKLPGYISESDCKLTLYKNCRNTQNIAITSLKPLSERKPVLMPGSVIGPQAKFHFLNSEEKVLEVLDRLIDGFETDSVKNYIILTCKTEARSVAAKYVQNGKYKGKCRFSTCRKFKGLEADAVILLDVDTELFDRDKILLYYVGTSRARLRLEILSQMTNEDCREVLENVFELQGEIKQPQKELADKLNTLGVKGK